MLRIIAIGKDHSKIVVYVKVFIRKLLYSFISLTLISAVYSNENL
jgi:hypothetical protein